MVSLLLSTFAFFLATFFLRRYFDDMGIEKTAGRGIVVFVIALAIAYGVAALVDWVA
ncbi:MAG: hypothetical protein ACM3X5_05405 [Bacillota bacterium]